MNRTACDRARELWDGHRAGDLSPADEQVFASHLAVCPACRDFADTLQGIRAAVTAADPDALTERRMLVAVLDGSRQAPSPLSFSRRLLLVPAAATALAACAALVWLVGFDRAPDNGIRRNAPAAVSSVRPAPAAMARPAETLTYAGGRRAIELFPGCALWLAADAEVELETNTPELALFRLTRGLVVADVGVHEPGLRFVVATPRGEVEARGTLFAVQVDPDGASSARVIEGEVEVRPAGVDAVLLTPGEEVVLGEAKRVAAAADLEHDRCLVSLACTPDRAVPSADPLPFAPPPTRVSSAEPDRDEGPRLASAAIDADRLTEAAALVDVVAAERPQAAVTRDLLAKLARAFRRAKLFEPAADAYRRLLAAFPASEAATSGLVALAQIEIDALAAPQAALTHFEAYLARDPRGYLSEAARAGRVRALARMQRTAAVIPAVGDYLSAHAGGFFVAEMLRHRAEAQVREGNCPRAVEDFRAIIDRWPGSREAALAAAGLGACGEPMEH